MREIRSRYMGPKDIPQTRDNPASEEQAFPCQDNPDLFFPIGKSDSPDYRIQATEAKQLCGQCGIRDKCLEQALENHEPDGIWGGTTPEDRRRMQRSRPI